jgi:hypothetical protein
VGSKAAISILAGHSDNVKKVKILDDFRVISASSDKTVQFGTSEKQQSRLANLLEVNLSKS